MKVLPYDGVKYIHKSLCDIMYETSLCQDIEYSAGMAGSGATSYSSSSYSASVLGSPEVSGDAILPLEDIKKVRVDMVAFNEKREHMIKRCRDVQKLSKQSIFSLHRGQMAKARLKWPAPSPLTLGSQPSHSCGVEVFRMLWKSGLRAVSLKLG